LSPELCAESGVFGESSNVLTGAVEGDALPEISADDVDRFVSQSAAYFRFLAI
jgi:hypothetical protein